MQSQETSREAQASPAPIKLPQGLPEGTEIQHVAFVAKANGEQTILMEFKEPRSCQAILVLDSAAQTPADMTMMLVPTNDHDDPELLANVWSWVEPGVTQEFRRGFLIMLWGARIVWSPGRTGVIASADRLETLRHAVIDFSFHDGETRKIEAELAEAWPQLEADTPLAFRFEAQNLSRQDDLARRFQQIVRMQARLARIDPAIHHPLVHPPTLGSQLKERLKDRTRLAERIEFADDQLDVLERVYEMCSNRCSEFVIAQKERRVEWLIVILLATQTVALIIDLLAANRI